MNFLLISDSPGGATGLGRISGDIARRLAQDGHQVFFLALPTSPRAYEWNSKSAGITRSWPIMDQENYGAGDLYSVVHFARSLLDEGLVVWTIWDATRCGQIVRTVRRLRALWEGPARLKLWGYFPVDGAPMTGRVDPLTEQILQGYDRIAAYTEFGARVLRTAHSEAIEALPHGLSKPWTLDDQDQALLTERVLPTLPPVVSEFLDLRSKPLCGVVATNQPRKDLGTAIQAAHAAGLSLWLHTDKLRAHWDVVNLLMQTYGDDTDNVLVTGHDDTRWTDEMLLAMYRQCRVTFAPGLGEGWGYPIAESWAAGVACLAVSYAGGREIMPDAAMVLPRALAPSGPFGTLRPVLALSEVTAYLSAISGEAEIAKLSDRLRARLGWNRLWPEVWRPWVEGGLK